MSDTQTAFLFVALLYVALPITAWTILHRRHHRRNVALWCAGGLLIGVGFALIGLRSLVPAWLTFGAANLFNFVGLELRGRALRRELALPEADKRATLACVVFSAAYLFAYWAANGTPVRMLVAQLGVLLGSAWLAWLAWRLYRLRGYRSAAMVAVAHGVFALTVAGRIVVIAVEWEDAAFFSHTLDFWLTVVAGLVAALYGNLGYIGIALECTRALELQSASELAREHERHVQARLRVDEQAALLRERERMLDQRQEMIATLAHEVRQPLNNTSAALQSAAAALDELPADREQAALRLRRAGVVLAQVASAVDNTLADAVLLEGSTPILRHDFEVDALVELAQGDIEPGERARIQVERATTTRTASMNAGLLRLALRNLLGNALAYAPPGTPVTLRICDSDEPLALVIEVIDQGPGLPEPLQARLFERGVRGPNAAHKPGHGLGLHIVRRVMDLHGGSVQASARDGGGLVMTLVIPQDLAD